MSPDPSNQDLKPEDLGIDPTVRWPVRSRLVASALGILFGAFGAHRFYLGYKQVGKAQIAVTLATGGIGGFWGMSEGWRILFGKLAFDAAGHRLCHRQWIHWLAAVTAGASVAGAGISAYFLNDYFAFVRYLPPPRGTNSIRVTASIATSGATQSPKVNVSATHLPEVQQHATDASRARRVTPRDSLEIERQPPSSTHLVDPLPDKAPQRKCSVPEADRLRGPSRIPEDPPVEFQPRSIDRNELSSNVSLDSLADAAPRGVAGKSLDTLVPQNVNPRKVETTSAATRNGPILKGKPIDLAAPAPEELAQANPKSPTPDFKRIKTRSPTRAAPAAQRPKTDVSATPSVASASSRERRGSDSSAVPRKTFSPSPEYPAELLSQRIEGLVKLRVRVGKDGRVKEASVYRSSGLAAFDRAALKVIYRWRFEPARRAGIPFEREIAVPVRFFIDDGRP